MGTEETVRSACWRRPGTCRLLRFNQYPFTLTDAGLPDTAFKHHLEASFVSIISFGPYFPFTCLNLRTEKWEKEQKTEILPLFSTKIHFSTGCACDGSLWSVTWAVTCHAQSMFPFNSPTLGFQTLDNALKTFVHSQQYVWFISLKRHTGGLWQTHR